MTSQYSSYHEGELAVQTRARVGSDGLTADAMYRAVMPSGVQRFLLAQQLAKLTEERPAPASRTEENAELARVLDVLLQK